MISETELHTHERAAEIKIFECTAVVKVPVQITVDQERIEFLEPVADTNFGNAYIFWDVVFGTRYLPADREPPEEVGIAGMEAFPKGFWAQWISPFRWARIRRESTSMTQADSVTSK